MRQRARPPRQKGCPRACSNDFGSYGCRVRPRRLVLRPTGMVLSLSLRSSDVARERMSASLERSLRVVLRIPPPVEATRLGRYGRVGRSDFSRVHPAVSPVSLAHGHARERSAVRHRRLSSRRRRDRRRCSTALWDAVARCARCRGGPPVGRSHVARGEVRGIGGFPRTGRAGRMTASDILTQPSRDPTRENAGAGLSCGSQHPHGRSAVLLQDPSSLDRSSRTRGAFTQG